MKKILLIIAITIFTVSVANSEARKNITKEYPWVMRSTAALGMGNAFYVKSDNKYAPFYNPAGLARVKQSKIDIIPLTAGVNKAAIDFYNDYKDLDTGDDAAAARFLADRVGDMQHATLSLYPAYVRPNFLFGVYAGAQLNGIAGNPILPELSLEQINDIGVALAGAQSYLNDRLQVGLSIKYQHRMSLIKSYSFRDVASGELDDLSASDFEKKNAIIADAGVIYNFYTDGMNPRIGAAVNNMSLMGDSFKNSKKLPYTVTISAGISPSYGILTTDFMVDYIDVFENYDQDDNFGKRLNIGGELKFWDIFALRSGLHQGYMAYGVGLDLHYLTLDYAYYQEEIGSFAGQDSDERHVLELVLGF